jgi:hypothetical protein
LEAIFAGNLLILNGFGVSSWALLMAISVTIVTTDCVDTSVGGGRLPDQRDDGFRSAVHTEQERQERPGVVARPFPLRRVTQHGYAANLSKI